MIQKTFSFKYILDYASRFHSRQTRTAKSLFFEPIEKYPSFKNKSVFINFNLFASIFLLILNFCFLNLCFAQETYNLDIIFKCTAWDSYPNMYVFGASIAGGDITGDGYSDIVVHSSRFLGSSWYALDLYVFFGAPVMDTIYDAVLCCPGAFGHRVSGLCIGDVNGDSIGDVIVGDEAGASGYGEARVFFGGSPLDTTVDFVLRGAVAGGSYGRAVACGDVNGDGCADIIVGAYAYDGFTLDGRVYVYYGGALLDTVPDVIISGHNGEAFGKSVGSGGDLNSDGYEDIVVGADENSEAYPGAGKVYVFLGGDPMDTIPDCWLHGEGASDWLGWFGCDIMRVQGSYDRMITSTRFYEGNSYGRGKVYVLYGGDPMDTLPDVWMIGESDSSALGRRSSSAGNINEGGFEEALAGAPNDYGFKGTGYNWLGDPPMDSITDAFLRGDYSGLQIGWEVACAGDVNGDGYDEVMFSNYAGINPTVWVCRYTGQGITEQRAGSIEQKVEIYPNPFSELINISFGREHPDRITHSSYGTGRAKGIELKIYDITGREVMVYEIKYKTGVKLEIDTKNLPCGVYFVQVESDKESMIKKVVKVR